MTHSLKSKLIAFLFCLFITKVELTAFQETFVENKLVEKNETVQKIESAAESKDYAQLGRLLNGSGKNSTAKKPITLTQLREIAIKHNAKALFWAVEAAQALGTKNIKGLGISSREFLQTAFFIETSLPEYIKQGYCYLEKEQTSLPLALEYDPETRQTFMVLKKNSRTNLGSGANKVVIKSILYKRNKPEIVARALQTRVRASELAITNKFRGTQGIMEVLACTKYKSKGTTYRAIYSKLYNSGSFSTAFKDDCQFSLYEKMKIALNILHGLKELHAKKIAHFDIAGANCLIDIPPGNVGERDIVAVIADLGRANTINNQLNKNVRVQGHPAYTPPEGLFTTHMKGEDYCYSDVYAVGCIFYKLFYEEDAPWQDSKYVKDKTTARKESYKKLVSKIQRYTKARRDELAQTLKKANEKGVIRKSAAFEHLILRMVNPDPKKRGTAAELHRELQKIMQKPAQAPASYDSGWQSSSSKK